MRPENRNPSPRSTLACAVIHFLCPPDHYLHSSRKITPATTHSSTSSLRDNEAKRSRTLRPSPVPKLPIPYPNCSPMHLRMVPSPVYQATQRRQTTGRTSSPRRPMPIRKPCGRSTQAWAPLMLYRTSSNLFPFRKSKSNHRSRLFRQARRWIPSRSRQCGVFSRRRTSLSPPSEKLDPAGQARSIYRTSRDGASLLRMPRKHGQVSGWSCLEVSLTIARPSACFRQHRAIEQCRRPARCGLGRSSSRSPHPSSAPNPPPRRTSSRCLWVSRWSLLRAALRSRAILPLHAAL